MQSVSASEFKNRFGKYKNIAMQGEIIGISSNGRDEEVALISIRDLRQLQAERRFLPASEMPSEWVNSLATADTSHMAKYNHEIDE